MTTTNRDDDALSTNEGVCRLLPGHDGGAGQVEGGGQVRRPRGAAAGHVRTHQRRARPVLFGLAHRREAAGGTGEQNQQQ